MDGGKQVSKVSLPHRTLSRRNDNVRRRAKRKKKRKKEWRVKTQSKTNAKTAHFPIKMLKNGNVFSVTGCGLNDDPYESEICLYDSSLNPIEILSFSQSSSLRIQDLDNMEDLFCVAGDDMYLFRLTEDTRFTQFCSLAYPSSRQESLPLPPARVCFLPHSNLLSTTKLSRFDISICQVTPTKAIPIRHLQGHDDDRSVRCLQRLSQRNVLCSVAGDIRIWDVRSGFCEQHLENRRGMYDICDSVGHLILLGECCNNKCYLFDLRRGDATPILSLPRFGLTDCALHYNFIISSSLDEPTARIHDLNGKEVCNINGWSGLAVSTSDDGRCIALSETTFKTSFSEPPETLCRIRKIHIQER